jgi:RNA polymerase sigma-70 factor (ECF subfamily)
MAAIIGAAIAYGKAVADGRTCPGLQILAALKKNKAPVTFGASRRIYQTADSSPRGLKLSAVCNLADERVLVEAAQQDPSRFGELYEKNFHRVYAFVARRVRDRAEAEDITAEVFHEALRSLGRFQWRGTPFAAWLLRIAANTLADRWQRAARRGEMAVDAGDEREAVTQAEAEHRAMLYQLVDLLAPDQRLVILRRFVDQKSVREIAQEMGRSEGAVKQLQFRALEALRNKMRSRYE